MWCVLGESEWIKHFIMTGGMYLNKLLDWNYLMHDVQ